MTETDLLRIESSLDLRLPGRYRELHLNHAEMLQRLGWSEEAMVPFYLTAEHVIDPNLEERGADTDTAGTFPGWWNTFVLIGTNGGGDYYCLRLDDQEGVWMIGSDCGDTPTLVAKTFQGFVETTIAEHEAEQARSAEAARQRVPFQREIDAHLAAISQEPCSPLTAEWATTEAIYPMFRWLGELKPKVSPRKLRLYGIALCRQIPDLEDDVDCVDGIALAKTMCLRKVADRHITKMRSRLHRKLESWMGTYRSCDPDLYGKVLWRTQAVYRLFQDDENYLSGAPIYADDPDLTRVYDAVGYVVAGNLYGAELASDLLREVLGNPFLPAPVLPEWRTPKVVKLARTMFREECFDRMSELSALLVAAGCTDERILAHCQRPDHHVRGCWVLDEILQLSGIETE